VVLLFGLCLFEKNAAHKRTRARSAQRRKSSSASCVCVSTLQPPSSALSAR
jgi:hypothetical protein